MLQGTFIIFAKWLSSNYDHSHKHCQKYLSEINISTPCLTTMFHSYSKDVKLNVYKWGDTTYRGFKHTVRVVYNALKLFVYSNNRYETFQCLCVSRRFYMPPIGLLNDVSIFFIFFLSDKQNKSPVILPIHIWSLSMPSYYSVSSTCNSSSWLPKLYKYPAPRPRYF